MKPLPQDLSHTFGSLKLYREDLDAIIGLIQDQCTDVVMFDNTHSYESLDEMETHKGSAISLISVRFNAPIGVLSLGNDENFPRRERNSLNILTQSNEGELLFVRIRDYILRHKRPSTKIFNVMGFSGLMGFLVGFQFMMVALSPSTPASRSALNLFAKLLAAVMVIYGGVLTSLMLVGTSRISLERRKGRSSFWDRNRDELLKYLLCAIAGYALCWIVSYLRAHL